MQAAELVTWAAELVREDALRSGLEVGEIRVTVHDDDGAILLGLGEGYESLDPQPLDGDDAADVLVSVAEQLQGEIAEHNSTAWPTCELHAVATHAERRGGRAVWWCRLGEHELADIGELGV